MLAAADDLMAVLATGGGCNDDAERAKWQRRSAVLAEARRSTIHRASSSGGGTLRGVAATDALASSSRRLMESVLDGLVETATEHDSHRPEAWSAATPQLYVSVGEVGAVMGYVSHGGRGPAACPPHHHPHSLPACLPVCLSVCLSVYLSSAPCSSVAAMTHMRSRHVHELGITAYDCHGTHAFVGCRQSREQLT
jgi:hypothetical protein|eukprot:COSAG01_NODE_584_length_15174_cov_27.387901_6_plen_195_part_00